MDSNPWKLQILKKDSEKGTKAKALPHNLLGDEAEQNRLTHLLSMFEVSFSARQRKNYLFYCLLYLINNDEKDRSAYVAFVEDLADR